MSPGHDDTDASKATPAPAEFLPLYRPSFRLSVGALITYLILTLAVFLPSLGEVGSTLLGGAYAHLALYTLDSNIRAPFLLEWFSTISAYPWNGSLGWGDNLLFPSLIIAPLKALGLSSDALFNILLLSATVLNGYCSFRLIYQLTGSGLASLLGGGVFLLGPSFLMLDLNPALQAAFLLPLVISASLAIIGTPTFRNGVVLGSLIVIATLTSIDIAVISIWAALLVFLGLTIAHPPTALCSRFRSPLGGMALGLLPTLLVVFMYTKTTPTLQPLAADSVEARTLTVQKLLPTVTLGDSRCLFQTLGEGSFLPGIFGFIVSIGALIALYRLTDSRHLRSLLALWILAVLSLILFDAHAQRVWFGSGFILLVVAFFSPLALLRRLGGLERQLNVQIVTNRDLIALFAFIGSFFLIYALGPSTYGASSSKDLSLFSIIGTLVSFLPISSAIAGMIPFSLALTVLGAFSLTRLLRRTKQRVFLVTLLGAVLLADRYPRCGVPTTPTPRSGNIERALNERALPGSALIVLPFAEPLTRSSSLVATVHRAPLTPALRLVNPTTERVPRFFTQLAHDTADFPSARAIRELAAIAGLRYIIVNDPRSGGAVMEKAARFGDDIRYIESDGSGRYLFELTSAIRLKEDTIILVPSRTNGILRLELKALYAPNEPHIPFTVKVRTDGTDFTVSEATVTANGQWNEFSFPLPSRAGAIEPLALSFSIPADARIWYRYAGVVAPQ